MVGEEQERQFGEGNSLETARVLQLQTGHLMTAVANKQTALFPIGSGNEHIFWFMREFIVIGPLFFCTTAWQQ